MINKNREPWNKGKKFPEISGDKNPSKRIEVRKKISEANKGKKIPDLKEIKKR